MSELSDLTASHDSVSIPTYVLSRLTLGDFGELESELESRAVGLTAVAAAHVPRDLGERVLLRVLDDVLAGTYSYGGPYFDAWAASAAALPALAHLSLRHKHKDMTREQATALVRQHPDCREGVLKMAGYAPRPPKKTEGGAAESTPGQSPGDSTSAPPEPKDSASTKSEA